MAAEPLLLFLAASLAVAATPGPSWAYVISLVERHGLRAGFAGIAGNAVGIICHAGLAAGGISALLVTRPTVITSIKWLGACYLIFLGVRILLPRRQPDTPTDIPGMSDLRSFGAGILVNLLNPKVPALMLAILPQTIEAGTSRPGLQMFATGILHACIASCILSGVAMSVNRLRRRDDRSTSSRTIERICGIAMIIAGLLMAATNN